MDKFQQFNSSLLFRGIDILVALDNVDVHCDLFGHGCQFAIFLRPAWHIARAEIPHCRRILHEKSAVARLNQRQAARDVRSQSIANARIKAVVDMRQYNIEIRLLSPRLRSITSSQSACIFEASSAR